MAREYELEVDTQYLPLGIFTLDVDYPDAGVQVTTSEGGRATAIDALPN